jgi:hypothetical protein
MHLNAGSIKQTGPSLLHKPPPILHYFAGLLLELQDPLDNANGHVKTLCNLRSFHPECVTLVENALLEVLRVMATGASEGVFRHEC